MHLLCIYKLFLGRHIPLPHVCGFAIHFTRDAPSSPGWPFAGDGSRWTGHTISRIAERICL